MSNNSRPYRATIAGPLRTTHYDYPSKEERGSWRHTSAKHTTVTSRKPLKPGTPVCWVNVYAKGFGAHPTKAKANGEMVSNRLHCIPVYLPGEGAEPACTSECDTLRTEVQDWASRFKQAQQEVERLTNLAQDWATTARVRAEERDVAKAEVERLTKERDECRTEFDELSRRHGIAVDRAQFAEAQRDAAQAQAMPAGKVVYGASGKFGINRDFQTIEFADKRLRDTYRKSDGWTWFTRVEES